MRVKLVMKPQEPTEGCIQMKKSERLPGDALPIPGANFNVVGVGVLEIHKVDPNAEGLPEIWFLYNLPDSHQNRSFGWSTYY